MGSKILQLGYKTDIISEIISMGYRLSGDTKGFGIYECFDTLQYAHEFGDVAHPILQAITPQAFDDLHRDLRIN